MKLPFQLILLLVSLSSGINNCFAEVPLSISTDHPNGVYSVGERVTWTIKIPNTRDQTSNQWTFEVLLSGQKVIRTGKIEFQGNLAWIEAERNEPGTLLLSLLGKDLNGKEVRCYGGAVYEPTKIEPSVQPPEDFDSFWSEKIAELNEVPIGTMLTRVDVGDSSIEYYTIQMNNIRGRKIYGQIARPVAGTKLPALLQVQWAGVYPLQRDWILWQAKSGWLTMNINAHSLPIDQPESFYAEKAKTELDDYPGQGNEDRETSYFLPMFLSCRRAVDYLIHRDDWNGSTMVVHGGSQGGYQAIATAGLHPAVTAFAANVPAGCDHTGIQAGRAPGWPNWASRTWKGRDAAKMLTAARYFDAMHFALRSDCDALIGLGLADTVCPAEGILATYNNLRGTKEMIIMPQADHGGDHKEYTDAFAKFLEAQKSLKKVLSH